MPSRSSASLISDRSTRCSRSWHPGLVLTRRRTVTPSEVRFSTPSTSGGSSTSAAKSADSATLVATSRNTSLARSTSACGLDGDVEQGDRPQLRPVADAQHLTVGHVPDRAVGSPQDRRAQRDPLDGAHGAAQVDLVADAVLVLDDHEQAGDAVPDKGLGAEAEGDAGDARGRDQRGEVDVELAEDHEPRDHPHQHGGGRRDDGRDRRGPGLSAGIRDRTLRRSRCRPVAAPRFRRPAGSSRGGGCPCAPTAG